MRQWYHQPHEELAQTWRSDLPAVSPVRCVPNNDLLGKHLADLRQSLVRLSDAEKDAVIAETQAHLLAAARAYEELGETPDMALKHALAAYGSPQSVGCTLSETYQATGEARTAFPLATMRRALPPLAGAGLVTLFLFLLPILWQWGWSSRLGEVYLMVVPWVVFLFLPLSAGWYIGHRARTPRAAFGTFLALVLLFAVSSPLTSLVYVENYVNWREVLPFIPAFFAFWMPTAPLAAHLASLTAHRHTLLHRAR